MVDRFCGAPVARITGIREASQGAPVGLAVSQPYTMAVAGRGQLVVPGSPTSLAAPFLTAVHVLISGHVQSRPPASGTVA